MIWLDALNDAWDELANTPPIAQQFRSKLISTGVPLDILAGMRAADSAPCLMLQTTPAADALFELGGMRLTTVPDPTGTFLVLSLEDRSRRDLFGTICADVVAAAAQTSGADALDQFIARLDAWRHFLRDRRDGLSRWETIGLIGELVILERLVRIQPSSLEAWEAPQDGLHDFVHVGHALEIKTSVGPAATLTISKLDQLESADLRRLDLLHVRLIESQDGLALGDLIAVISDQLTGYAARRIFENAILRRGLLPGDEVARSAPKVQVRTIDSYTVTDGFPRLLRSELPNAVTEATYTLEVRAISPFLASTATVLDAFLQGDHS
jgi:hypothetical protein